MFARPSGFGPRPIVTIGRLQLNVTGIVIAIEVIGAILFAIFQGSFANVVVLDYRAFGHFEMWRLVSYLPFAPLGFFWLIGLFFFYLFGTGLEGQLGTRRYVQLLLILAAVSSLLIATLTFAAPAVFRDQVLGAQLVTLGVFFAYCYSLGSTPSALFQIPINIIGYVFAALAFFQYVSIPFYASALSAIVVCALGVYLTRGQPSYATSSRWGSPPNRRKPARAGKRRRAAAKSKLRPRTDAQVSSTEVDRILDKINQHGFQSLTTEEKKTLERSSKPS